MHKKMTTTGRLTSHIFFILNIAVGGNWSGAQGIDNSIFPQKMEVDYVRIYQENY